jgi:hypothetical protein
MAAATSAAAPRGSAPTGEPAREPGALLLPLTPVGPLAVRRGGLGLRRIGPAALGGAS